jgi:superfamily II DNA or RNA helicase
MRIHFDLNDVESYKLFLRVKALPRYSIHGRVADIPDEYAHLLGVTETQPVAATPYRPTSGLFDYQRAVAALAIRKRKFAVFMECGYGKTLIHLEFVRYAQDDLGAKKNSLIVAPLMTIRQELEEVKRFYGDSLPITTVAASGLQNWLDNGSGIGITNYEAIKKNLTPGRLGCLVLVESSLLKSHYGKWGTKLIDLGRGLEWKLCETGTPAPNDRIEYANHAVFLDAFPTVNSFLARFFVNRGQTSERWELKPHALKPFYRTLSHWCIFFTNPTTYGFVDNAGTIPPIHVHIHDVSLTDGQKELVRKESKSLYGEDVGGITSRSTLAQIAKGNYKGKDIQTQKPLFIRSLIESWPDESTIVWCRYNPEQTRLEKAIPEASSIRGSTAFPERERLIEEFKSGNRRTILSKPKLLGFGLNLQIATRQIFSACEDSYELFWQAVKRSNRVGSTRPLNVHLPVTEPERPMMENVLRKARMVQRDTEEQEHTFKEYGVVSL